MLRVIVRLGTNKATGVHPPLRHDTSHVMSEGSETHCAQWEISLRFKVIAEIESQLYVFDKLNVYIMRHILQYVRSLERIGETVYCS